MPSSLETGTKIELDSYSLIEESTDSEIICIFFFISIDSFNNGLMSLLLFQGNNLGREFEWTAIFLFEIDTSWGSLMEGLECLTTFIWSLFVEFKFFLIFARSEFRVPSIAGKILISSLSS